MNCRFLLINFFLTWRLHYTYNALIFKFNQLFGLYQYVCRACCNCKIIFLFIFYNLMGDLVNFFFHLRNSCFIFCRNLYTHFVHEMIVEPGTKASAGSQADDHVSHLLHQNTMYWGIVWFYFRGRGQQNKCNFWIKDQSHLYQQINECTQCMFTLKSYNFQILNLIFFTFDLWNMSSWTC